MTGNSFPGYISYLLRLWPARSQTGTVWRASLETPNSGERAGFANLSELAEFLETVTSQQFQEENLPGFESSANLFDLTKSQEDSYI